MNGDPEMAHCAATSVADCTLIPLGRLVRSNPTNPRTPMRGSRAASSPTMMSEPGDAKAGSPAPDSTNPVCSAATVTVSERSLLERPTLELLELHATASDPVRVAAASAARRYARGVIIRIDARSASEQHIRNR